MPSTKEKINVVRGLPAQAGMTLVDVLVGSGMMLIIFLGVVGAYQLSLATVGLAREKASALAVINNKVEALRALPYDQLGTVGGIPAGSIAQTATSSLNGMMFTIRTLIEYVDDSADGSGASDSNHITADYKRAKIEASWVSRGITHTASLTTSIAPSGVEQLASGGTLTINVIDSSAQALQGASVRIVNASTTPTIDVTSLSDSSGSVSFPGTPAASNYQITVSKSGYSTAQTYSTSGSNPNPSPAHLSVVNQQTTTSTFAIDTLGSLHMYTYTPPATATWTDDFTDAANLASQSGTQVSGGALKLASAGGGNYVSSGTAQGASVSSQYLQAWQQVTWAATTPANTAAKYQVMYDQGGGSFALVPDGALSGNSAGFTAATLDISGLSIATYPSLALAATLSTTNSSSTPSVDSWSISYGKSAVPLGTVGFTIHGAKQIGTQGGGGPVYKYSTNATTTSYGEWNIDPLEWDSYTIGNSTYDFSEICPFSPVSLSPGASQNVSLYAVSNTANSVLVYAKNGSGTAIAGATIALGRAGATTTMTSSSCGQAFFPGLSAANYYLTVTKSGYTAYGGSISVSGDVRQSVTMQ